MTDEDLASYKKIRSDLGYPEVSDAQALIEATALVNFLMLTYRPDWKADTEGES